MEDEELFKEFHNRLNLLDVKVRLLALKYARAFHLQNHSTKEESLEKAIAKAELETRDL